MAHPPGAPAAVRRGTRETAGVVELVAENLLRPALARGGVGRMIPARELKMCISKGSRAGLSAAAAAARRGAAGKDILGMFRRSECNMGLRSVLLSVDNQVLYRKSLRCCGCGLRGGMRWGERGRGVASCGCLASPGG
eukprot:CAMPEP_0206245374 /NCGR_PEP_ID=MMETSP0047_2-20121206/18662_1 /ASSEMBLY_ACC=CAM_ASM_000192 /TAXON_ID=195065 /ORGANISM="Chroomonas mesostigmatica_cf, Strain CCMP1168" /LENGTH=137 /DNA_ID=CAMNT_0053670667 /DNA_START=205 /DNA_END=614 /DNA_ORIENTATION=+